jgi:hypothetical protein
MELARTLREELLKTLEVNAGSQVGAEAAAQRRPLLLVGRQLLPQAKKSGPL